MRVYRNILLWVAAVLVSASVSAQDIDIPVADTASVAEEATEATEAQEGEKFDAAELIFGHIGDAYEYHITEINGHPIAVPLLAIVHSSSRGWFVFPTNKVTHGDTYEGFYIAKGGDYDGKIVEDVDGQQVRPFDMSITKNVFALLLSCTILLALFIPMARSYGKNPLGVPTKGQNLLEVVIMYIEDDVIKPALGDKWMKFSPYLLTVFFFILVNNLMGLVPIFPFGANLTGNISVTFVLAMFTYFITNLMGTKHYWKDIFWPDVPLFLKTPILPLMPVIELISTFTKPVALMIRLFANIIAGHMIILVLISLIFIFTFTFGAAMGGFTAVISVLFTVFMFCLELLVAFIQAYVFTMLSAIFIGMAQIEGEHGEEKK